MSSGQFERLVDQVRKHKPQRMGAEPLSKAFLTHFAAAGKAQFYIVLRTVHPCFCVQFQNGFIVSAFRISPAHVGTQQLQIAAVGSEGNEPVEHFIITHPPRAEADHKGQYNHCNARQPRFQRFFFAQNQRQRGQRGHQNQPLEHGAHQHAQNTRPVDADVPLLCAADKAVHHKQIEAHIGRFGQKQRIDRYQTGFQRTEGRRKQAGEPSAQQRTQQICTDRCNQTDGGKGDMHRNQPACIVAEKAEQRAQQKWHAGTCGRGLRGRIIIAHIAMVGKGDTARQIAVIIRKGIGAHVIVQDRNQSQQKACNQNQRQKTEGFFEGDPFSLRRHLAFTSQLFRRRDPSAMLPSTGVIKAHSCQPSAPSAFACTV